MAVEKQKSWLARPEGKFGTALTVGAGACVVGLVIYMWGTILPWVVTMLENTLTAVALAGILAVIGVVLFDPRWRNLMVYGYKSLMRTLTGFFIEIDPIGVLKTYIKTLEAHRDEMDTSITNLGGQIKKLAVNIEENERARQHCLALMQQAKKQPNEENRDTFIVQSRQADRLSESNKTLQKTMNDFQKLFDTLRRVRAKAAMMVEDMSNEVELRAKERAALLAGYSAFSNARKILQGGGDEREMFDMALEHLADDYGMKMGEIETFMMTSKGVLGAADLENGIYEANALAQLEAWEQSNTSILGSNTSAPPGLRIEAPPGTHVNALPAHSVSAFDDLFQTPADKAKNRQY
jgi:hypothetical protein